MATLIDEAGSVPAGPDRLKFVGSGGTLFGIHLVGLLLTLITFGIYRFWWRTNVRRYMWSNTLYLDEPLEYTGKGLELFVGFLIVLALVIVPGAALYFLGMWLLSSGEFAAGITVFVLLYGGFFVLLGAALYRVMVYRLSRTQWRGIRGALGGSAITYALRFMGLLLLQLITLGLAAPYASIKLYGYMLNNMWFGSGRFRFQADWKPLFKSFLVPWVLLLGGMGCMVAASIMVIPGASGESIATAMMVMPIGFLLLFAGFVALLWYAAAVIRTVLAGLEFEGVRFSSTITGARLLMIYFLAMLLLAFTLFLAYPWVQVMIIKFVTDNIEVHGRPDFGRIAQNTAEVPKFGEGLGEAFL